MTVEIAPSLVWRALTEQAPDKPHVRMRVVPGSGPTDRLVVGSVVVIEETTDGQVTPVEQLRVVALDPPRRLGLVRVPARPSRVEIGIGYTVTPGRRGTVLTFSMWVELHAAIDRVQAAESLESLRGTLDALIAKAVPGVTRWLDEVARDERGRAGTSS